MSDYILNEWEDSKDSSSSLMYLIIQCHSSQNSDRVYCEK